MLLADARAHELNADHGVELLDKITGTNGDDTLDGTGGADSISGLGGDDYIFGGGGRDTLDGGAGDDHLIGAFEDSIGELLLGGDGDDVIEGNGGPDTIDGGAGDDIVVIEHSDTTISGGAGGDLLDFFSIFGSAGPLTFSFAKQGHVQDTGFGRDLITGFEGVYGSMGDDQVTGDNNANLFKMWDGFDKVKAGGGADVISLDIDSGGVFDGGAGTDTLIVNSAANLVSLDLSKAGKQQFSFSTVALKGIENLSLTEFEDRGFGDKHDNVLAGGAGDDRLSGNAGSDKLAGDGLLVGDFSVELTFNHGSGVDSLDGGAGADTLIGGGGADILTGGSGVDHFIYLQQSDSDGQAADVITDLSKRDVIDLSAIDADQTADGDQAFHLVQAFTGHAGELVRAFDAGAGQTSFLMDTDGDGQADMTIVANGNLRTYDAFVL